MTYWLLVGAAFWSVWLTGFLVGYWLAGLLERGRRNGLVDYPHSSP